MHGWIKVAEHLGDHIGNIKIRKILLPPSPPSPPDLLSAPNPSPQRENSWPIWSVWLKSSLALVIDKMLPPFWRQAGSMVCPCNIYVESRQSTPAKRRQPSGIGEWVGSFGVKVTWAREWFVFHPTHTNISDKVYLLGEERDRDRELKSTPKRTQWQTDRKMTVSTLSSWRQLLLQLG
jgi:hypothetical protein